MTETRAKAHHPTSTLAVGGARRSASSALVLLIIAGAQLMVVLDATIVNIALPSMGEYFDKNQTDMTWALNAYTLAFGGLLLIGGRSGDLFGRRRMFIVGLGLFTLGSFLGERRTKQRRQRDQSDGAGKACRYCARKMLCKLHIREERVW